MYISKPLKAFSLCSSNYECSSADTEIQKSQKIASEKDAFSKMMEVQMLCQQTQQNDMMMMKLMSIVNNNTLQIMNLN